MVPCGNWQLIAYKRRREYFLATSTEADDLSAKFGEMIKVDKQGRYQRIVLNDPELETASVLHGLSRRVLSGSAGFCLVTVGKGTQPGT